MIPRLSLSTAAILSLAASAFAQNDECTGAISVVQGLNGPFTNVGSTTSAPAWPCAAGGNDIWFSYVAPGAGSLTVSTCTGTTYDSALQLFDGNGGCGAIVSLACNDDSCALQSSVTINVNAADTIFIRVGGFASQTGSFQLDINGPIGSGTLATATNYGDGCYERPVVYYESFATGTFDLGGTPTLPYAYLNVPNGVGGYALIPGSAGWFTPTSTPITLADDSVSGALTMPFTMNYPGGSTNTIRIGSNGMIFPTATTTTDFSPSVAELLTQMPRWCPIWRDLNPSTGGTVQYDVDPSNNAVYVTFTGVFSYGTTNPNTFQVALSNTGVVEYRYQAIDLTGPTTTAGLSIVGYSTGPVGSNPVTDPGTMDLSTAVTQGFTTGPGGRPLTLRASNRPISGTTIQMALSNIPGPDLGAVLVSFSALIPQLDLTSLGMPGCFQHIPLAGAATLGITIGNGSVPFSIPLSTQWLGTSVFLQGAAFTPGVNLLGVESSNGVALVVGNI